MDCRRGTPAVFKPRKGLPSCLACLDLGEELGVSAADLLLIPEDELDGELTPEEEEALYADEEDED